MSVSNATMRSTSSPWFNVAIVGLALGAIVGAAFATRGEIDGWRWLHWVCKPLTTVLILWLAWRAEPAISARYRLWIVLGMLCSLAGDVFLMLPQDLFVAGLVSFLLAHLCFIVALLGDSQFGAKPWGMLACVAYSVFNLWALWPSLPVPLHLPVVIYVLVLAAFGGQAVVRERQHASDVFSTSAHWSMMGALIFMLSDTLLAWDRFRLVIPLSAVWVLVTYYTAMWCLARSVRGSR